MSSHNEEPNTFHTVQAERDLEANWDVDLAKKLEDYLLKICSGEITVTEDDNSHIPVNFAEAALLLQGSVQVYSRKVEYLYNLVLHALEFLSHNRQQEQLEGTSIRPEQNDSSDVPDEEHDQFWVSDDVLVDQRNCLDASTSKDASFSHLVKPPANLVVLEGDCLDTTGDGGELESYLLATHDLYRDFILLDPCDAAAVNDFLKASDAGKGQNGTYRGSSSRKSFQSPTARSAGGAHKLSLGKNQNVTFNHFPMADCSFRDNSKLGPDPPAHENFENGNHAFEKEDGYSGSQNLEDFDLDDDDDPWKPLNPHEPGNLKVKPFRKVKAFRRNVVNPSENISITTLFPLARMYGTTCPKLTEIWETQYNRFERHANSQSPPLFEKLRQSLANGGRNNFDTFGNGNEEKGYDNGVPNFGETDDEIPECMHMDEDLPHNEKHDEDGIHYDTNEAFEHGEPSSQASLEDLCRSHLDALLANIAETEKQTDLAARVSSWKQKIEHNLEEQELHPPFDIHVYCERILDKLSLEADSENVMSFAEVVKGHEKHDVARSFSALLQLVNNGDIDLDRGGVVGESICYTALNPFHIRSLRCDKRREGMQFRLSKKRVKSPISKGSNKENRDKFGRERSSVKSSSQYGSTVASPPNCKVSAKLGKISGVKCTPDSKRRRRSRLVEQIDLHSTG